MNGPQLARRLKLTNAKLAALLGVSRQTIYERWKKAIPVKRLGQIERRCGVPRERLRPDLYPRRRSRQ